MINKRQFVILVLICVVATKLQRMFSVLSLKAGRDGWLILMIVGAVDILFLMFSLWFFNRHNNSNISTFDVIGQAFGRPFKFISYIAISAYFIVIAVLPFVATHDLFANVLFDQLDYSIFGIFYCLVVFFVALRGLQTMGRQGEIYFYVIALGFVGIAVLGFFSTDLSRIFPVFDIDASTLLGAIMELTIWFGDYIIVFFLVGKVDLKKGEKVWWSLIIPFAVIMLVIGPLLYAVFYGIYNNLAGFQNNAASSLTQFSLLALDIGRVDWFLVLFEQISTIFSSSVFIFIGATCFCSAFGIKKITIPAIVLTVALFLVDILLFIDMSKAVPIFIETFDIFEIVMNCLFPFFAFFASLVYGAKIRRREQ